ncbi:MAG: serine protease [Alloprevotella sp.]|jgi:hypothetical protein|nr:MAG: serine protease [Alloprevotella sp.]
MTTIDNSLWEQFLLSPMYYIYWGIALISSLVFTIQTIMLFVGFDTDADFSGGDVAFDVDGLALVSVKTVACFLLGFGWSGVILAPLFENAWVVALISLGIGALFMFGAWILLKQVLTLSQDNTFHADKIVGYTADVYLRIPADADKSGKIMVSYEGSLHELQAFNAGAEEIPTGAKVHIVEAIDDATVRVEHA